MIKRLTSAVTNFIRRVQTGDRAQTSLVITHVDDSLKDIVFRPIGPDAAVSGTQRFLCPVTRQELKPGDRIFQCTACQTAFSEAGWQFLKKTDRGKCCGCGQRKTVRPLTVE